ncbi:hypothetical protein [Streptomyces fulvorobeus]|uniref:Uncharacterized protein n=1 Tax=Streptomyces fulvorobeus TaxID=284028 RepID=A0A7Y9HHG3_9ACTN|nr:hypothetical protein [Streptomyces fulvorobeus]NYE44644.1 hypothetical protein [Streptomyces fulvorobeus]
MTASIPLHLLTIAADVNDLTQTLYFADGIPPVAGRPERASTPPQGRPGRHGV